MKLRIFATLEEAIAEIAACDAARGFPRMDAPGGKVGGGRHSAAVRTTSSAIPVPLRDGRYGVPVAAIQRAGRPVTGDREVDPDTEYPVQPTIREPAAAPAAPLTGRTR